MAAPAYSPNERDLATIVNLASQGATLALVARQLGVTKDTLRSNELTRAAWEEGLELDEGMLHKRSSDLVRQNDNLGVAASMLKFRLAVVHRTIEPRADTNGPNPELLAIEAEENRAAELELSNEKIDRYLNAPTDLDSQAKRFTALAKTGNYIGNLAAFKAAVAAMEAPSATDVEDEQPLRYLPVTEPDQGRTASEPEPEPEPERAVGEDGVKIKTIADLVAEAEAAMSG